MLKEIGTKQALVYGTWRMNKELEKRKEKKEEIEDH